MLHATGRLQREQRHAVGWAEYRRQDTIPGVLLGCFLLRAVLTRTVMAHQTVECAEIQSSMLLHCHILQSCEYESHNNGTDSPAQMVAMTVKACPGTSPA